jgi:hypothetical protein
MDLQTDRNEAIARLRGDDSDAASSPTGGRWPAGAAA